MIRVEKRFTLLELLIVISVIMILITILLPALKSAKEKAKEIVCCSNLKQLGNTVFFYADDSGDYLPDSRWGGNGDRGGGGIYSLSGYSAYDSTYKGYWWTQQLRWYLKNDVKVFHCQSPPIDTGYPPASGGGDISYVYNGVLAYTDSTGDYPGVSPYGAKKMTGAKNPSFTESIGERPSRSYRAYICPDRAATGVNIRLSLSRVHKNSKSGNFVMLDGSVRSIANKDLTADLFKYNKSAPLPYW